MIDPEYNKLTDLGRQFGVSSHVIGRWLAELGLRVVAGNPTPRAWALELVRSVPTGRGDGDHPYYIWHVARTVKLLEDAGHHHTENSEMKPVVAIPNVLVGPFSSRISGSEGYEILNGNGNVFGWFTGEWAANWVVRLLNLADKHGKFS